MSYEGFRSRKFVFSVLCLAIAVGLTLAAKLDSGQMADCLKWIAGLYLGSNAAGKIAKGVKK